MIKSTKILLLLIGVYLFLGEPVQAQMPARVPTKYLSTPELIEAAIRTGRLDRATADLYLAFALTAPQKLPQLYRSRIPWDGTGVLAQLQARVQTMPSGSRQVLIQSQLAAVCSNNTIPTPNVFDSPYFYIEYTTIGGGLTIEDYADALDEAWETEVDEFGWAAPPLLPSAPNQHYYVLVTNLGAGLYGYVSTGGTYAGFVGDNPNTPWPETKAYASCMVLNSDYSDISFPSSPQASLEATAAHEFNHSIQYGYLSLGFGSSNAPDQVFIEGGATWMEDEVFDDANDNYYYLWPQFDQCLGQYNSSAYRYWIVFRALTEPYGTGIAGGGEQIMQDFWEASSRETDNNLAALNQALVNAGTNLPSAYHAAAIALRFNKPCTDDYTAPYCLEEGPDYLAAESLPNPIGSLNTPNDSYNGSIKDNYSLNWISLPVDQGIYNLVLHNRANGGQIRASAICDTGTSLQVSSFPTLAGSGQTTTLYGFNSAGCTQATAVITNQAQTGANPGFCTDHSYQLTTNTQLLPFIFYIPVVVNSNP